MSGYASPSRDRSEPPSRHGTPPRSRASSRAPSRVHSRRTSPERVDPVVVLTDVQNFQDLPSTDPLSSLLSRYIPLEDRPTRDILGDYHGREIGDLVRDGSWRALARYTRDTLVSRESLDIGTILELWHIRLHALLRLQLTAQHVRELTTLDRALAYIGRTSPDSWAAMEGKLPFEIEVFRVRAAASGGEYDAVVGLLRRCQERARAEGEGCMWRERARRVSGVLVGLLLEHKQYTTALGLLDSVHSETPPQESDPAELHATVVRFLIHLALGTTHAAAALFLTLDASDISEQTKRVLRGLLWTCQGRAADIVAGHGEERSSDTVGDLVVANNEAVAMLDTGALGQAVETLRHAMESHEPDSYAEPYIFNMATLAELDSGSAVRRKVEILGRAAAATASGEVIKPAAFKLA